MTKRMCFNCGSQEHEEAAVFCDQCGTMLPDNAIAVNIKTSPSLLQLFCPECGNTISFDPNSVISMQCSQCSVKLALSGGRLIVEQPLATFMGPVTHSSDNMPAQNSLVAVSEPQPESERFIVIPQAILSLGGSAVKQFLESEGFTSEGAEQKMRKLGLLT